MNSMGVKRVIVGRCRRRRSLRSAPVESATAALRQVIQSGAEQVLYNSDRVPSIMTAHLYTGRERANQGGPLCSVHRSTLRSFLRFHGRTNLVLLSCRVRQLGTRGECGASQGGAEQPHWRSRQSLRSPPHALHL